MSMRSFCALAVEACLSFLLLLMVCQLCGSRISFDPTRKLNLKNINLEFADSDLLFGASATQLICFFIALGERISFIFHSSFLWNINISTPPFLYSSSKVVRTS